MFKQPFHKPLLIHLTVEKQAKRMLDIIVETTNLNISFNATYCRSLSVNSFLRKITTHFITPYFSKPLLIYSLVLG